MKTFITLNGTKAIIQNFKDLAAARQSAIKTCDHSKEVLVREITDLKDYTKK